jgi:Cytochrome c
MRPVVILLSALPALFVGSLRGETKLPEAAPAKSAAERGYHSLTQTPFIPAAWRPAAYENAWKRWEGVAAKPADYAAAFRSHYGLPEAIYPNDNLPMGLRPSTILFVKGISIDCLVCHGGSIFGKSYVGLGNSTIDLQALFEDLSAADGRNPKLPFAFSNVRGTTEAGGMAVYLLGFRDKDLKLTAPRKELGLHDDLCEDTPAWWHLKKKKTMYHTGGADARSVRSKMQFMMTPVTTAAEFHKAEAAFQDIHEYLMTIEAPKYPLPVETELASKGEKLFRDNCSQCHGTYGAKASYPNKVIPLKEIGTDPKRFEGIEPRFGLAYNESWFAKEKKGWLADGYPAIATDGYQAPPLDGVWATAPYFHNGSVPTLYDVLKSDTRPKRYTRSFQTTQNDYDSGKVGWKTTNVDEPNVEQTPYQRRRIYDTRLPGRSNSGHTYGDHLTDAERRAVIEYLKTL